MPVRARPAQAREVLERESGLLMPRFGISEKRGTQLSLAYYQVIARNMDATVSLDYFSSLGLGKGLEYRYILGEDNEGVANLYHISGLDEGDTRYALDWQHLGTLPGKVRLAADAEYVSSRDYFADFGEVAEEYNKDQAQSVLTASRHWQKVNLSGQLKYTKDLQQSNEQTLQRLPEVDLTVVRQRLGETPLYLGFEGTSTYFWRQEGLKGERLSLRPALSAFFQPGQILEIAPEVGYRERLYWTSDEGPGFDVATLAGQNVLANLDEIRGTLNFHVGTGRHRLFISDESSVAGDGNSFGVKLRMSGPGLNAVETIQ